MIAMRAAAVAFVVPGLFMLSGCATVLNGQTQQVGVESQPSGAICTIDDFHVRTPAMVVLRRDADHHVDCALDGYAASTTTFTSTFDELDYFTVGNLLFGGAVVGMVIDVNSGGAHGLHPKIATVKLTALNPHQ